MKAAGIICEYDPFHLGHQRQFRLIREELGPDTAIVCVMSGNYVQRGMPAQWDKFTRAEAALAAGADLVLELPITGVLRSAEGFAETGVDILTRLECVDALSFGSECGSAQQLMDLAAAMDQPEFQTKLKETLSQGHSYARARQIAVGDTENILGSPNNILGLEYCRAIRKLNSHLTPLSIRRNGSYHASLPDPHEPSATAVRSLYPYGNWQELVPKTTVSILEQAPWYSFSKGERAVLAVLRSLTDEQWEQCAHGSEGLWRKAMKAARTQSTWEAIVEATKSKRYPRTRIQRLLLCAYLGIMEQLLQSPYPYVRVLGSTQTGFSLLRNARDKENLALIHPGDTPEDSRYYHMEQRASDLFTLFAQGGFDMRCAMEGDGRLIRK